MRLYDPRADIVFRKIFGTHKDMCISLLNALLPLADDEKIVSIEYQDPDVLPETPELKNSVVDVRCTDAKKRTFLVEMQMYWTEAFLMRALFNASKAFASQTERGMRYEALQPVYSLCLLNENMPDTREYTDEYTHTYYIQHEHHRELRIGGMVFVFVELMKFQSSNRLHNRLAKLWLTFLTFSKSQRDVEVPEELYSDPIVSSAVDCLKNMYLTDAERRSYDKYWDTVSYERTLIAGKYEEGVAEGMAKGEAIGMAKGEAIGMAKGEAIGMAKGESIGMAKGREEGIAQGVRETASKMKTKGMPIDVIADVTGLSPDEINKL